MGRTASSLQSAPRAATQKKAEPVQKESYRDTVEAIVVAFILALVVRGFEAQAFVIPTGSMAPTLMGRHKEISCPQCGFVYSVNASDEVEGRSLPRQVYSGICVNCRFQARQLHETPSFKGDRILVMMFPYDLPFLPGSSPPERWDVVVFRPPNEPELSYDGSASDYYQNCDNAIHIFSNSPAQRYSHNERCACNRTAVFRQPDIENNNKNGDHKADRVGSQKRH